MNSASEKSPLNQLRDMVIAQKSASLPFDPPNPELAELHRLLTDYDAVVSQNVFSVLQGNKEIAEFEERQAVDQHIQQLGQHTTDELQRDIRKYSNYLQRLDRMQFLAFEVAGRQLSYPKQEG